MKRFTYLILFILAIFIIFFAIKFDYVKRSDFPGKEIVKNSFFYIKRNYLINRYSNCFIDKAEKVSQPEFRFQKERRADFESVTLLYFLWLKHGYE